MEKSCLNMEKCIVSERRVSHGGHRGNSEEKREKVKNGFLSSFFFLLFFLRALCVKFSSLLYPLCEISLRPCTWAVIGANVITARVIAF